MIELPVLATNALFFLLVCLLTIMPIPAIYGAYKIGQVFWADPNRPRNQIIRVMLVSSATSAVASVYVSALSVQYLLNFVLPQSTVNDADFGSVTFAAVLVGVFIQPFLKWRALARLGTTIEVGVPETQDQREDRQFGEERRKLEQEHMDENLTE